MSFLQRCSGLLLLTLFLYIQLPFSFFHQHDTHAVCELYLDEKTSGELHYHEYEHDHCFACEYVILKKDLHSEAEGQSAFETDHLFEYVPHNSLTIPGNQLSADSRGPPAFIG